MADLRRNVSGSERIFLPFFNKRRPRPPADKDPGKYLGCFFVETLQKIGILV
jgi:hypothetical protein